jgi:hypothetical protein
MSTSAGTVAGLALVVYMVVGGSDMAFGYIMVMGGILALAVFVAALVVQWIVETLRP